MKNKVNMGIFLWFKEEWNTSMIPLIPNMMHIYAILYIYTFTFNNEYFMISCCYGDWCREDGQVRKKLLF